MKKLLFLLLSALFVLTACSDDDEVPVSDQCPVAGNKVAYIINMAPSEIFQLCLSYGNKANFVTTSWLKQYLGY